MKKNIEPLFPERYYHVFNRSINGDSLFKTDGNYHYFLQKMYQYLNPISEIYCYCLLQNHFHFLIKIKSETELRISFSEEKYMGKPLEYIVSKQFSHFFNGYSQAFNKMHKRTGGLFEEPFRRKEIISAEYLTEAILYIHLNPIKHKLNYTYLDYPYSSYNAILQNSNDSINSQNVIGWFGNLQDYIKVHEMASKKYM